MFKKTISILAVSLIGVAALPNLASAQMFGPGFIPPPAVFVPPPPPIQEDNYGTFVGRIVAEWDGGGRKMKLLERFQYIGPNSITWHAPAGSEVDGASIPQFAWSIIGGPFGGQYRDASVIHDIACEQKRRPWQSVHEAFYTGMLARGVPEI